VIVSLRFARGTTGISAPPRFHCEAAIIIIIIIIITITIIIIIIITITIFCILAYFPCFNLFL
jgi:heme/copper-type cytochrome/quinol oxidase subunit 2